MKMLAVVSLVLVASTAAAQEQITPAGPMPSYGGAWDLGIYPMTRNVTTDIGRRNKWGHGFTILAGKHLSDVFSLEAGVSAGWIPQVNRLTDMALNFVSPNLSIGIEPFHARKLAPYILGGLSYEIYTFEAHPANTDMRDLSFISGHVGAGLRYRVAHNMALRMELNSELGNGSSTYGAFMGLSFMKGLRRPAAAMRTVTVTNTVTRTDTLRITAAPRVDTVRTVRVDTVTRFRTDAEVLLTLDDVNFDFDKSTLRPEAGPILDRAVTELRSTQWAAIHIQVVGFTDSRGTDDYNLRLGMRRAKTVNDYLVGKGIAATRITILSGGEGSPVADNATDAGRAQNRRVIIMRGLNR